MIYIFILFIVFAFTPADPSLQEPSGRIVCFGNSLTAGYGIDPDQAYPALLEDMLREKGYDYEVVNAGLSGETSAGGLNRINWLLRKPVDIFILELGGNDGLRGLPLGQTRKNLQSIIEKVRSTYPDAKIVVAGMKVPPNMGEQYGNEFEMMYPELAEKHDAVLIPFLLEGVGGDPALNLPDGIHPNPEGQKIVAKNVFQAIEPLLE